MSAPLYFLPGIFSAQLLAGGTLSRQVLADRGLGDVLADVSLDDLTRCEITSAGPGGKPGMLLSALPAKTREPPRRLGYYANDKHVAWTSHRRGDVWVGVDAISPPTPADLLRHEPLGGHLVMLEGRTWEVPVIRCPLGGSDLPRSLAYDDDERLIARIKAQYLPLWERTEKIADSVWGDSPKTFSTTECVEIALAALALNYRVGKIEQSVLAIVDDRNVMDVLRAVIDWPKVLAAIEAQKKTTPTPTSINSPPGGAGSCPATGPAAETST